MMPMILRRAVAALALASAFPVLAQTDPADVDALPSTTPTEIARFGPEPMQIGHLRVPQGKGPFPVAIVLHGGCFLRAYGGLKGTEPISSALAARGIATWNVEYRTIGDAGGGYPGTYRDWGASADYLRVLARKHPLDLKRVVAIGHSAGAPGAAFLAARGKLPARAASRGGKPLPIGAVVAIDGPADLSGLAGRDQDICGQPVIAQLLGGTEAEQPARYKEVSPLERLPLRTPIYFVSASPVLPRDVLQAYRDRAAARGDVTEAIFPVGGDHFNIIMPGRPQWGEVEALIVDRAFGQLGSRARR